MILIIYPRFILFLIGLLGCPKKKRDIFSLHYSVVKAISNFIRRSIENNFLQTNLLLYNCLLNL